MKESSGPRFHSEALKKTLSFTTEKKTLLKGQEIALLSHLGQSVVQPISVTVLVLNGGFMKTANLALT